MRTKDVIGRSVVLLLSMIHLASAGNDLRLVEAVKNGDKAAVRSLLEQHVDVNTPQPDRATALAWASHRDDLETAELLIRAGANVNAANDYGVTPLWLAASKASTAMAEKLLNAGANPNASLLSGETVLMTAVRTGNLELVNLLLAGGANSNAKENRGAQTPLMWAVAENHADIAKLLVDHGAAVNERSKRGFTPLLFAAQRGDLTAAKILLAAGADVTVAGADGKTPLLIAASAGREALSLFLLNNGSDANASDATGFTVLHYAAAGGRLELVKALLAHGVNPNNRLEKTRPRAIYDPTIDMLGATPLLLAAEAGNADVVRLLAMSGADVHVNTKENTTPLMVAAGVGHFEDFLNEEAQENWRKRHLETSKLLVDLGADVTAAGAYGYTALHGAAFMGIDPLIQFLVEKGAKLDVMDGFGQTPLSIAEGVITVGLGSDAAHRPRNVRPNTAELLLKLGATPLEASGVQVAFKKGQQ